MDRDYYNYNGIKSIDIIESITTHLGDRVNSYQGFCVGTIVKYLCRFPSKGHPVDDLEKARDYLDYLIESAKEETEWV